MLYGGTIASGRSCKGEDLDIVSTFEVPYLGAKVRMVTPWNKNCCVFARHMANTLQEPSVKRTALKQDWCTARCIQEPLNVFCNAWWSWNYFLRTELTLFAKPVLVLAHVAECILLTQWQLLQRLQSFLAFCKGLDNLDKLCCSDDPSPARRPLACHCHIRVHRLQLLQKSGGLSIRENPKRRPEGWTNGADRRAECQRVAKCVKAWGDGGYTAWDFGSWNACYNWDNWVKGKLLQKIMGKPKIREARLKWEILRKSM